MDLNSKIVAHYFELLFNQTLLFSGPFILTVFCCVCVAAKLIKPHSRRDSQNDNRGKAGATIVIITSCFIFCYGPYMILWIYLFLVEMNLMKSVVLSSNATFLYLHFICTNMLATLNSAVNPVIYYSRVSKKESSVKRVVTERVQLTELCNDRVGLCNKGSNKDSRSSIPNSQESSTAYDKKALVASVSGG